MKDDDSLVAKRKQRGRKGGEREEAEQEKESVVVEREWESIRLIEQAKWTDGRRRGRRRREEVAERPTHERESERRDGSRTRTGDGLSEQNGAHLTVSLAHSLSLFPHQGVSTTSASGDPSVPFRKTDLAPSSPSARYGWG
jgi:hypothetical protein